MYCLAILSFVNGYWFLDRERQHFSVVVSSCFPNEVMLVMDTLQSDWHQQHVIFYKQISANIHNVANSVCGGWKLQWKIFKNKSLWLLALLLPRVEMALQWLPRLQDSGTQLQKHFHSTLCSVTELDSRPRCLSGQSRQYLALTCLGLLLSVSLSLLCFPQSLSPTCFTFL